MAPSGFLKAGPVLIPEAELVVRATRAGGPGGQHVNTSSTRIEIRWNVETSTGLTPDQRDRLRSRLRTRIDSEGWVRVVAATTRSQVRNRQAATARLAEIVAQALRVPKRRQPSRVPRAERERRLEAKRRRSSIKRERHRRDDE